MKTKAEIIQVCMRHSAKHNWLVHRILVENLYVTATEYAKGRLLDIGCGTKPWKLIFDPVVDEYIGVDHIDSPHTLDSVDIVADAYNTTVESGTFDTVISTFVLEHLERPQDAVDEMYRVLGSNGHVLLAAPLFWHLHEEPRDFYRYTKYGFIHLFETAGFEVIEAVPMSGAIVTFGQEFCYLLSYFNRGLLKPIIRFMQYCIQRIAYWLNRYDWSRHFTWAYLIVARKP